MTVAHLTDVSRRYNDAEARPALDRLTLRVDTGQLTAVLGASGSGKSTLFNLLAGLDRPTTGRVEVAGTALGTLSEHALALWRGKTVGLVFQAYHLLPTLTALENIIAPMEFTGLVPRTARVARARGLLERFELGDHAGKRPAELSGGQQQRVAIARALANDPPLVLADEPTGNLDTESSALVLSILRDVVENGRTVIMITHDPKGTARADRSITLADGRLVPDSNVSVRS